MGTAGAKAFGDMLLLNKAMQTLDVSDNSFGKVQVGDQVKLKSSGEMKVVTEYSSSGITYEGKTDAYTAHSEYEWESQVPAFCAGVAASPSLISVSTTFLHAPAVSISHSSLHSYHVLRSSIHFPTRWVLTEESFLRTLSNPTPTTHRSP